MKYTITIITEVEAKDIVQAVSAASIISDAIDSTNDDYEVIDIQFKKKNEIPPGYTPRMPGVIGGGGVTTYNPVGHNDKQG